jgi:hypothetical protein
MATIMIRATKAVSGIRMWQRRWIDSTLYSRHILERAIAFLTFG